MSNELTAEQKLVLAAAELHKTKATFSAEELVVTAWHKFPSTFGLQGFESRHPDSNKVFYRVMGKKGIRAKGWIQKVKEKTYRITEAGRAAAMELGYDGRDERVLPLDLSRASRGILVRLLASQAVLKVRHGREEQLAFRDAEDFWNISARSNANTLASRLADVEAVIHLSERIVKKLGSPLVLRPGPGEVDAEVIGELRRTHRALLEKFKQNLDYIRTHRRDERIA